MKKDAFLNCVGYYGISTGAATSLEGIYSLTSGTTGIVYNQLYETGYHFLNNKIYSSAIPLINVYNENLSNDGIFSGHNGLRVGYEHSGNFSLLLDIEYSGCSRIPQEKGMILVSTAENSSNLNSGFIVGITESNRLYFNTSGYSQTLDKELGTRDFVYVSLNENKYISFGIYDLDSALVDKSEIILSEENINAKNIYIGNFVSEDTTNEFIGFSGRINQVVLFNDSLEDYDIGVCSNCSLVTGFGKTSSSYSFIGQKITGVYFSGVSEEIITGYENSTQKITTHNGDLIDVIVPSGVLGGVQTGQYAIPLFEQTTILKTRESDVFYYDYDALDSFSRFYLYFNQTISSGDSIELYSYPQTNANIGKRLNGLNWPTDDGEIQLIGNGLNETLGVDYSIYRNQVSGFFSDDVLSYDILVAPSVVTAYSGYWSGDSKLLMSGGGYFPPSSQYLESDGLIQITGIESVCLNNPFSGFGYDLHMNGQKLISGMHYNVEVSGDGYVVSLSGLNLPQLIIYPLYDPANLAGGPTGIESVDDSELAFIPQFPNFRRARLDVTSDGRYFGQFTGFGEQVWVNGIRQLRNLDYRKIVACDMITGEFNPENLTFTAYNSISGNNNFWNIATPPTVSLSSSTSDAMTVFVTMNNPNNYPTGGICLEVFAAQLSSATQIGSPCYLGTSYYAGFSVPYTGYLNGTTGSGYAMARYHSGNIIGEWAFTPVDKFVI